MRGTEKQVEYAESLKALAIESYNNEIKTEIEEDELDPADRYIVKLECERDEIAAFNGDAGVFISVFKSLGGEPDYRIARACYKKYHFDKQLDCNWTKEEV